MNLNSWTFVWCYAAFQCCLLVAIALHARHRRRNGIA